MPRIKTTKIRRIKTTVLPQRVAAKRKKKYLQPPTDFEDVAVYFSKEEWRYLAADQMDLYRQVMMDNYQTIHSLGYQNEKPTLISKIEQDEELYMTELENYSQDAPRFITEELHISLLRPEELTLKDVHLTSDLENSTKTSSNENGSLPPKPYNFRDRGAVEYTMFYDDKISKLKPHKSLQSKSSYGKSVNVPRSNTEELHTSLVTPEELTVQEIHLTGDLENSTTKSSSTENQILPPKRQYNFRDRGAVEYTMFYDDDEDEVSKPKSHKSWQRKSSYGNIVDTPRFNTEKLHTCLLTSEKLMVEEIHFTDDQQNNTKTSSNAKGGLPSKRQYNFRDRGAVEYTMFYDNEVRGLKPHKSLQKKSNYDKIQPKCGRYICSECGKSYSQKPGLMKHQKIHTGISIYVCSKCDKCFTQRANLKRHERCHSVERPFACSYCGKGFTESSSLLKHQRIHTGFKPFACSECGKTFSISTYLIVHQRTHTGEKPYVCADCGKSFAQSSHLITHQRTHTGIKPYACIECGKGFTSSSHLITHQRTHTGERPYHCGECGMAFKHSTHLVLHKRKHTGERPYKCTKCPRTFAQRPQLLKHQQKRHAYE